MLAFFAINSCEGPLEEEIFSQLAPSTLLINEGGINTVLNSAYSSAHYGSESTLRWSVFNGDFISGTYWEKVVQLNPFGYNLWNLLLMQITHRSEFCGLIITMLLEMLMLF